MNRFTEEFQRIACRPFTQFGCTSLLAAAVYSDSLRPLVGKWLQFDQSMGHAMLLAVILIGWLLSLRGRFDAVARQPSLRGVPLVALCSLGWAAAAMGDIELLEQLALLAMVLSIAVLVAGWRSAMVVAPPLLMFLFCVPIWDDLNDMLVDISAAVVGFVFEQSPVTAHIAGNAIYLPQGTVVIAGGCSGLRYLIVGLALANLASALNQIKAGAQAVANLITVALMLAVNWLRIIIIVTVAYLTEMQSSLVRDHEMFGWVVFGAGILPLLLFMRAAPQREQRAAP